MSAMHEAAGPDLSAGHCALAASDDVVRLRGAILGELSGSGIAVPPLLVYDLVASTLGGPVTRRPCPQRPRADDVARCFRGVADALRNAHGPSQLRPAAHRRAATAFLSSWLARAPRLHDEAECTHRLELVALGVLRPAGERSLAWLEWRRLEEQAMRDAGSIDFLRALAEIRALTGEGFAAMDERIWSIQTGDVATPRLLEVPSVRKSGTEAERFRDNTGPFHEIAPHGIPPDPGRLVATDLGLLGAQGREARALLAAKIADASLSVRFGSMPRPAARRPRVLLVAVLEDDVECHVLDHGHVSPRVEPLREMLVHALPACLRALVGLQIDFEAEVHRDGPFASGRLQLRGIQGRNGRLPLAFRSAPGMLGMLAQRAPWFFADAPVHRPARRLPATAAFDASYLLTAGRSSRYRSNAPWSGCICIEPLGPGAIRISSTGALPCRFSETLRSHQSERAAGLAASAFGGRSTGNAGADIGDRRIEETFFA